MVVNFVVLLLGFYNKWFPGSSGYLDRFSDAFPEWKNRNYESLEMKEKKKRSCKNVPKYTCVVIALMPVVKKKKQIGNYWSCQLIHMIKR